MSNYVLHLSSAAGQPKKFEWPCFAALAGEHGVVSRGRKEMGTKRLVAGLAIACIAVATAAALTELPPLNICGKVVDATSGQPVTGICVESRDQARWPDSLSAHYFQALTDSLGFYQLLAGATTVTFAAVGYDTLRVNWSNARKPCVESRRDCTELRDVTISPCWDSRGRER